MNAKSLPNSHCAQVHDDKILRYLLNASHPRGGPKAAFFKAFGFDHAKWQALQSALLAHPQTNPLVGVQTDEWGTRYEVLCSIASPDGRNPCIRTVWQVTPGSACPRLITAIPR